MTIHYVKQHEIDYSKWDNCISRSFNGSVYALSWYLDIVAGQWDALVEDDYDAVMPLIFRRNRLLLEIYVPPLSGQLGVFSEKPVSSARMDAFLNQIPGKFRRVTIQLNRHNSSIVREKGHAQQSLFELDLITSYEKLKKNYPVWIKERIAATRSRKFWVMKHLSFADAEWFIEENTDVRRQKDLRKLSRIIRRLLNKNRAEISGVYTAHNVLCAIACYVKSSSNVMLLFAAMSDPGREHHAHYLLLDDFLQSYSSRNVTLSFDYSDSDWDDDFYMDFSALRTFSLGYHADRRPAFLRWL